MKQSNSACELSPTRDTSPVDQSLTNRNLPTKEETALLETQLEESLANAHEHKSPTQIPTLSPEQTGEMAPLRRSGRQPRATQKASPTTTTTKVIIKKPKTTRRKNWSAEDLLTNAKSPLVNGDIRAMLSAPAAWEILTADERAEIIMLLPAGTPMLDAGTPEARPDMASLASDDSFRHDCARYAENLGDGKHDPQWLEEAWSAHDERAAGEFEEYLEHHFEEEWGVKLPDEMKKSLSVRREDGSASRELSAPANGKSEANGTVEVTGDPRNGTEEEFVAEDGPPEPKSPGMETSVEKETNEMERIVKDDATTGEEATKDEQATMDEQAAKDEESTLEHDTVETKGSVPQVAEA
ncbi:HC-toxin synthetase [Verticillium dahliae VDG1]|nr:HC-toxin synthetase [Verticillium dahliae VDG1]